jgi:hypothetical protein
VERRHRCGHEEGEPERPESPGEQQALSRPNPSGGEKGCGSLCGMKPSEHRPKAKRFWEKVPGRRKRRETSSRSRRQRKALKGEAYER